LADSAVNNIYLNGNFNENEEKGDASHQIIKCLDSKCSPIHSEGTDGNPAYYVNADKSKDNNYANLLIKCTESNNCVKANGKAQAIYLNSNYNSDNKLGDSSNELIQCSNNECKPITFNYSNKPIYYINGAKETDNEYHGLLIECTGTEGEKCKIVNGQSHSIYINGDATNSNSLIRCINSVCQAISSNGSIENKVFYINAGWTEHNVDSLIACDTSCTVQEGSEGAVYLNGNYNNDATIGDSEHQLIICSKESCSPTVANDGFYLSTRDKNGNNYPKLIQCNNNICIIGTKNAEIGFYFSAFDKNDDKYPILIECTSTTCERKNKMNDGFYLSGGDKSESGEDYKKLIQCAKDHCIKIESTHGYYHLNNENNFLISGDGNSYKKLDVNTIKSTKCIDDTVGYIIWEEDKTYYRICTKAEKDEDSTDIQLKSEVYKTEYYSVTNIGKSCVLGAENSNVLVKVENQSITLTTTSDADKYSNIYIDSKSHEISDSKTYNKCNTEGSVTRFTISNQILINTSTCVRSCSPISTESTNCPIGYYLINSQKSDVVNELSIQGILYYCDESSNCGEVPDSDKPVGYLRNADINNQETIPYIVCTESQESITCKTLDITATDCKDVSKVGDLIKQEENETQNYKICLEGPSSKKALLLNPDDNKTLSYLIKIDTFTTFNKITRQSTYIIIDVKEGNVILHQSSTDKRYRKYVYTNDNYEILNNEGKNPDEQEYCKNYDIINEFKLIEKGDSYNYYKKNE